MISEYSVDKDDNEEKKIVEHAHLKVIFLEQNLLKILPFSRSFFLKNK